MSRSASCVTTAPLAPDPALPYRDALLDETLVRELVAERAGLREALRVERRRVKYRFGEGLRMVHRVHMGSRAWLVASRTWPVGSSAFPPDETSAAEPGLPRQGVWSHAKWHTTFWAFPHDRRRHWSLAMADGRALTARAFPGRTLSAVVQSLSPERALIARVDDMVTTEPVAYLKAYAPGTGLAALRILEALHRTAAAGASGLMTPPRVLGASIAPSGSSGRDDVLLIERVRGAHMSGLGDAQLDGACRALGRSAAALHALPPPNLPRFDHFSDVALDDAARLIGMARPDVAAAAETLTRTLKTRRPPASGSVWIHGDLNALNWLVDEDSVRLIDFDQSMHGPAAVDLGGVLGWLRARRLEGQWTPTRERVLVQAFLSGYADLGRLPDSRTVAWFHAAALLVERALRAVTRYRPRQLACLPDIVAAAMEVAGDA